jgi:hypothetical protein
LIQCQWFKMFKYKVIIKNIIFNGFIGFKRALFRISSGKICVSQDPIRLLENATAESVFLKWETKGAREVEVRIGLAKGTLLSRSEPSGKFTTGKWIYDGMVFFLQMFRKAKS